MIGEVVGNFRIVSQLGKGGMGVVYRAEHVQLGRPVALKMLQAQFTNDTVVVQRFFNEARAASAIDHPGIVEVYDYGVHTDGRAYLAMALLKGETLAEVMERGWIPPRDAAMIVEQAAHALAAAHAVGIWHRDLKPDNLMLVPNELARGGVQVKLLDFGIAKLADQDAGFKTETGYVIGTPLYMSPEQCMGAPDIDHRTDLYSLGCILYHLLAGKPPFEHACAGAILAAHLRDQPPDPRVFVSDLPEELVRIVMRCLAKNPADRFGSAIELRDALAPAPYAQLSTRASMQYVARSAPTTATGAAGQMHSRRSMPMQLAHADSAIPSASSQRPLHTGSPYAAGTQAPNAHALKRIAWLGLGAFVVTVIAAVSVSSRASMPLANAPHAVEPRAAAEADVAPETGDAEPDEHDGDVDSAPVKHKPRRHEPVEPAEPPKPKDEPRPRLSLASSRFAPHARIMVRFPAPIASTPNARAWLTVAEPGGRAPPYDTWLPVTNGARTAFVQAPTKPGTYEARLYANDLRLQSAVRFVVESQPSKESHE